MVMVACTTDMILGGGWPWLTQLRQERLRHEATMAEKAVHLSALDEAHEALGEAQCATASKSPLPSPSTHTHLHARTHASLGAC